MSFIWPQVLLGLLLVPAGLGLYMWLDRRRRRRLAKYGATGTTDASTGRLRIRSRVAPVLMLCGVVLLPIAMARPQAVVSLPQEEGIVVLSFDVSASMAATDLTPTRMDAAKAAAKDFVAKQPTGVTIGVVAFSDSGVSVQPPTDDRNQVDAAIDRLAPQRGTSLAGGILASLKVIAVAEAGPYANNYYSNQSPAASATPTATPVPAGTHAPASIVLLSDGENNESPDPHRRRSDGRQSGRAHLHRGHRQPGRQPRSRWTVSSSTPSSTRRRSSRSQTRPAEPTTAPPTPNSSALSTTTSTLRWSFSPS
jgi:Ca-activated chloride channel family protein